MKDCQLSFQEVDGELVTIFNEAEALADEDADELTEEVIQRKSKSGKASVPRICCGLQKEIINYDFSENELRELYPDEEWNRLPDEEYHRYSRSIMKKLNSRI